MILKFRMILHNQLYCKLRVVSQYQISILTHMFRENTHLFSENY